MNLVAECTTISAPCSSGLKRYGVPNVLSTISGILYLCAISATASTSIIFEFGFPNVSIYTNFVFSFIAFSKFCTSSGSTNVVVTPYAGNVCDNKLYDPPYNVFAATIWSPAFVIFSIAYVIAAAPDATASPATPPSRAATLSSNTPCVEFVNLPYMFPASAKPNLAAACSLFLNT